MAAIAVFTKVKGGEGASARYRDELYDLTFVTDGVNSNYTVGGILLTSRQVGGMIFILSVDPVGHANTAGTAVTDIYILSYDYKRNTIQLFGDAVGASGVNEAGAIDISNMSFRVRVLGN